MVSSLSQEKRVVVVVGQCGTGKSSFIRRWLSPQASKQPTVSSSTIPVTVDTDEYESKDGNFILIDTVGLGMQGSDLGLSQDRVQGKLVHFVVLLHNLRWEKEFDDTREKLSWAKLQNNVSRWAAHRSAFDAGDDRASAFAASDKLPPALTCLEQLDCLTFERVPHKSQPPFMHRIKAPKEKAAVTPVDSKNGGWVKQWFGQELAQLTAGEQRMHDSWSGMGMTLPKQIRMQAKDWQQLDDLTKLRNKRQSGESLLKFHLLVMFDHANFEQNDHIMIRVNRIVGLKEHIDDLYKRQNQTGNEMSSEKYADYIEALFQCFMEGSRTQKRFIVDFLRTLS